MTPTADAPAEPKAIVYPYPGLRAFNTDEAEIFFGRTDHVDDLLLRLKTKRFLGIVGPSGCGKSSLIRAGVIPALHAGLVGGAGMDWQVAIMRPGTQPLKNLSIALQGSGGPCSKPFAEEGEFLDAILRRGPMGLIDALTEYQCDPETNLLLLVDQFEELFRFERESDGSEAQAFVELLLASARSSRMPVYVILTMRSHFLGRCPIFRGLPEALNDSQYLTPRLNRDEQRQAIEGPAQMFNTTVRPEVVNRILNEMGSDPDQLPLMQHLLMRMWRKEQLKAKNKAAPIELTLETYKEVGGLSGCVLSHAESIYERLQEGDRRIAELMWRRLTDVTSDGALTRRECEFDTLCKDLLPAGNASDVNALRRVVEEFRQSGRSLLMPPPPEPLVEKTPIDVSHESIIRQWKRLRDWAYDEHMITRTRRNVGERVKRWKADPNKIGYLLSGVDLAEAKIWQQKYPHQLSPDEAALLKESITKEEADVRKEEEVKHAESLRTKNRWLKGLTVAAFVLAIGSVILALVARHYESEATKNAEIASSKATDLKILAEKESLTSQSYMAESELNRVERLANVSINTRTKPQLRLLLALEARHGTGVGKSPIAEDAFFKALSAFDRFGIVSRALPGHRMRVTSMTRLDQQWLLTGSEDETVRLWDLDPKNMNSILLPGQAGKVSVVAAHPSGRWAAAGSVDGTLRLWNIEDRKKPVLVICFHAHVSRLTDIEFSAGETDGKSEVRWLVTAAEDGSVCRWDMRDPAKIVASATSLAGNTEGVLDIAIASDGATLATGSKDGTVRILDLQPNKPKEFPLPAKAHTNWVKDVALSADNQWLATGSLDRSVKFWNLNDIRNGTRSSPTTLMLGAPVRVVSFSNNKKVKDNLWLAVGDDYGQVRIYKVKPSKGSPEERTKLDLNGNYYGKGLVRAITFDEENQCVASVHEGSPVIWVQRFNADKDTGTIGEPVQLVGHEGDVTQLVFRKDSKEGKAPLLVSAGSDGIVRQWDLNQNNWALSADESRLLSTNLPAADWIEKGRFLFTAKTDKTVTFWPYDQTNAKPLGNPLELMVPLKVGDPKVAEPKVANPKVANPKVANPKVADPKVADPPTLKEKHAAAGQYVAVALPDHKQEFYIARLDSKDTKPFKTFESPESINGIALNRIGGAGAAENYHLAIVTKHQLLVWSFTDKFLKGKNTELTELVQAHGAGFTPDELHDVRLSGDGKWAACRSGGRLLLCPIEKGATFEKLSLGDDAKSTSWRSGDPFVNQAKFSALMFNRIRPGGKRWFAAGDDQGQVFLYDLDKDAANVNPRRLQGPKQPVTSFRFSANDHWLAALSAEGIWVWDLYKMGSTTPTGLRIKTPQVTKFAFDPLERWIVTGHANGLLMQWDLATLKEDEQPSPMRCFDGRFDGEFDTFLRREVVALNFEDNEAFTAISADGAVRRWRLAASPDVSNDELWRRIGRGLTELEWNDPLNKVAGDKPFVRGIEKQVLAAFVQESSKSAEFESSVTELIALVKDDPNANLARFSEEVKLAAAPQIINGVIDRYKKREPGKADEDLMRRAAELTSRYRLNEDRVLGTLKWKGNRADMSKLIQLFYRTAEEKKYASALNIFENDLQKSLTDGDAESQKIKRIAVEAHAKLANELVQSAKLAEAKAHLVKAQTLDQNQPAPEKALADLEHNYSRELLSNAIEQIKIGNVKGALEAYRRAREIDPNIAESPEAYFRRFHVEHLIGKALDAGIKGDLPSAEATYREAQKLDPSYRDVEPNVFVHGARARALVADARGEVENNIKSLINARNTAVADLKFDAALGKLKQAAKLDSKLPLAPEAYLNFLVGRNLLLTGRALGLRNDARMKAALLEADERLKAAASAPEHAKAKIGDPEALFQRYALVLAKFPEFHDKTHPEAISKRVESLLRERNFDQVAILLEGLREIDPLTAPDAACWKSLCWFGCLHDPKNLERYASAGEMAVFLQPENGNYRDARGLARALRRDYQGAIDDFRTFALWTPNQRKRELRLTLIEELGLVRDGKKKAEEVLTDRLKLELQGIVLRADSALTENSERDPTNKTAFHAVHNVRLQAGQKYALKQVGRFRPVLRMEDAKGHALFENDRLSQIWFVPHHTDDYRVVVSSPSANATGDYQLEVREIEDHEFPFDHSAKLTPTDPLDVPHRPGSHRRVFELKLMAGAVYTIRMESSEFDPYLRLEDSTGQQVAFNDDFGGELNARIDFQISETGLYRVICTSFVRGATGRFHLHVSEKD